jgi:hypothetical protein
VTFRNAEPPHDAIASTDLTGAECPPDYAHDGGAHTPAGRRSCESCSSFYE